MISLYEFITSLILRYDDNECNSKTNTRDNTMLDIIEYLYNLQSKQISLIDALIEIRSIGISPTYLERDLYYLQYGSEGVYLMERDNTFYFEV